MMTHLCSNSDHGDSRITISDAYSVVNEDEKRLATLGYRQEFKRIFGTFTNYGLTASMISILLGVIPLYTYQLQTGGPVVLFWSWLVVGLFSINLVACLSEICSTFPTMGALYYWAYRLGGPKYGPFASWMAGWSNLLGQVAGVSSGAFAGSEVAAQIIYLTHGYAMNQFQQLGLFILMLTIAGIVNTFAETMLTGLCYISVVWQIIGTLFIVTAMFAYSPKIEHPGQFFTVESYHNDTGFQSAGYVTLIGCLAAASVFTGYDTGAHIAEETTSSHRSSPRAMMFSVYNALILGLILIAGMNVCIKDINSLTHSTDDANSDLQQAYTILWQQTVGNKLTVVFLCITLVAIECSNCANLTSCARMIYSFSRDSALPFSHIWYHVDKRLHSPIRAIWISLFLSFLLALPGISNPSVLGALFSMTATGLYTSYIIPVFLRITVSRNTFKQSEFNFGKYSVPMGIVATLWGLFMVIILCLPQQYPPTTSNINYSPVALGFILVYAISYWCISAHKWFNGPLKNLTTISIGSTTDVTNISTDTTDTVDLSSKKKQEYENVTRKDEIIDNNHENSIHSYHMSISPHNTTVPILPNPVYDQNENGPFM